MIKLAEIARDLGATVIDEPQKGLIHALLTGFRYFEQIKPSHILHTDTDSYPLNPKWAENMVRKSDKLFTDKNGGQLFAPLIFLGSLPRDSFRTAVAITLDGLYAHKNRSRPHGPNGVIKLDQNNRVINAINAPLDKTPVTGTDCFIHERIISSGGGEAFNFSIDALMLNQGDRYENITAILRTFLNPEYRKVIYQDWYASQPGHMYRSSSRPKILNY